MALNWYKYDTEVQNDDAIKRNRLLFDLMQRDFNHLDGFYLIEICILIDVIMEDQTRKRSAEEIEKSNREIKSRKKIKEGKTNPLKKTRFCE